VGKRGRAQDCRTPKRKRERVNVLHCKKKRGKAVLEGLVQEDVHRYKEKKERFPP